MSELKRERMTLEQIRVAPSFGAVQGDYFMDREVIFTQANNIRNDLLFVVETKDVEISLLHTALLRAKTLIATWKAHNDEHANENIRAAIRVLDEALSGHVDEPDTEDIVLPSPPVVRTVSARFVNAGKIEPRVVEEEGHVDETVCIMTDVVEVEIFVGVCPVCKFQDVPIDSRYCPGCGRRIQVKEG